MRRLKNILVTGGAGFIGCNFIHGESNARYFFEKVDICDRPQIERILKQYDIDTIIHFAAESHVDRSILGPEAFMKTNVMGTFTLLDCARNYWKKADGSMRDDVLFHHISTDEVYGSLVKQDTFLKQLHTILVHHILQVRLQVIIS